MIDGRVSKNRVLTLGSDPEVFAFRGNKLLPAFEFLPPKGDGNMIFWDGFQAEWNYNHLNNYCQNNLVKATREKLQALSTIAAAKGAKLSLTNVVRVPQVILNTAHPMHVELGCQPSFNAYRMKGRPVPDPRKLSYRFAGGHMIFGGWEGRKPSYEKIIKTLDSILGVWSVGVARHLDNPIRRQYYGLAGEFRAPKFPNSYGVEYRVLSNWWLVSPAVMQLTFDIGRMCVRLAASRYGNLWAGNQDETVDVINNCDYKRAESIIKRNEPMFRWLLRQMYGKESSINAALLLMQVGIEPQESFLNNWHFEESWIEDAKARWARWEQYGG